MKERREVTRRPGSEISSIGSSILSGSSINVPHVPQMPQQNTYYNKEETHPAEEEKEEEKRVEEERVEEKRAEEKSVEKTEEKKKSAPKKKKQSGLAADMLNEMTKVASKSKPRGTMIYMSEDVISKLDELIEQKRNEGYRISRSQLVSKIVEQSLQNDDID